MSEIRLRSPASMLGTMKSLNNEHNATVFDIFMHKSVEINMKIPMQKFELPSEHFKITT